MPSDTTAIAASTSSIADDPFQWLEDIHGTRQLEWVKAQNDVTEQRYMRSPDFERQRARILEVLDSDARIPYVYRMGDHLFNFWRDQANPRGVWRRTTLEEYRKPAPAWEILLDIDALNRDEDKAWVFKGARCLEPDYRRCLISLSPDGGDAVAVREFDLTTKRFVEDGFNLPVAKSDIGWIDHDHIYVGTDFGPGSMTKSSYPRIVKAWTRGTLLADATEVFAGRDDDLAVSAWHDPTPGFERDFVSVDRDFFHSTLYQNRDGTLVHVPVPDDAGIDVHREWLLVHIRSAWDVDDTTWPAGALLAIRFDDFMAGARDFVALFVPDDHTALSSFSWTRHHVILNVLDDVKSRLEVLTPAEHGAWPSRALPGAPALSTIRVVGTDSRNSDEYWLDITGYLMPATLQRGVLGDGDPEVVKQAPAFFDASRFTVSQHFATSQDGTRVPYFEIAPKDIRLDGGNPTLLYGYGGFEISMLPGYSGSVGRAWLERGGVYVVANIRGGGEYGPRWHKAALKENRPRAYEDFAAVAQDLVRRKVTSPAHLGVEGGSNGGLLTGNMLTRYPQLFGAVVIEVPLLDMKRYTHLSAGASWIAEYGDPDTDDWNFIRGFSPYHNVKEDADYPPVLFYTTTSDDRVGPVQARKMAAKMLQQGRINVWFYENLEGGHGGGADNRQSATMHALAYEFLWHQLN